MARADRVPFLAFLFTVVAIVGLVALAFLELGLPDGISVSIQGPLVVGSGVRFFLTVREHHVPLSSGTYLSLGGMNGSFELTAAEAQGHPWGRANVWNLSGLDLPYGRTFALDATPTWAAVIALQAAVWTTPQGIGAVRFMNGDAVDFSTVSVVVVNRLTVTTTWPLTASALPDAPLVLAQAATIRISVHETAGPFSAPAPLFLSIATKPMYYTMVGVGSSDNPWNVTALWNITGADLAQGLDVVLSATPRMAAKGVGIDVIVWSPRGSLDAVRLDSDGAILTPDAVRLWVDTTFSFSVASA